MGEEIVVEGYIFEIYSNKNLDKISSLSVSYCNYRTLSGYYILLSDPIKISDFYDKLGLNICSYVKVRGVTSVNIGLFSHIDKAEIIK